MWFLAQASTSAGAQGLRGVFVASAVLVAFVLVAFVGYSYLRKWMRGGDEPNKESRGFTLADLRDLHRQGKMSDAEYEATKAQLIGAAKKMTDAMPPVLPRQPNRPAPPTDSDE